MLTLASILEDGTLLFNRYVRDSFRHTQSFNVTGETDMFQWAGDGLMTVEILKDDSKVVVVDPRPWQFHGETYATVRTKQKGYVKLENIKVPTHHMRSVCSVESLGETVRGLGHPVLLKVGDMSLTDVTDVVRADNHYSIVNKQMVELAAIKTNRSGGATAIDQYAYVSMDNRELSQHREVERFMEVIAGVLTETQGQMDVILWRPIRDNLLVGMAVYETANIIGQGEVILTSEDGGNTFELTFTERTWVAPDLDLKGPYEPVLAARPDQTARGFRYGGREYSESDIVIVPFGSIRVKDSHRI